MALTYCRLWLLPDVESVPLQQSIPPLPLLVASNHFQLKKNEEREKMTRATRWTKKISTRDDSNYGYPTTNGGMQNVSSVGICIHCTHVFARLAPICMLSWCLLTKFLHWSSVRSLLRVRCWLGRTFHCRLPSALSSSLSIPIPHMLNSSY